MKIEDYPQVTIILRGISSEQAEAIVAAASTFEKKFAVEITLNTPNALKMIKDLKKEYQEKIFIGAGTVRTIEDIKETIKADADFVLGPHKFTKEMIALAKNHEVLTVPSAMTPSEIDEMFLNGADIVKVFPAAVVTPRFFKDVQAPLGKLPLMAVGGISKDNAKEYFDKDTSYVGVGSSLFEANTLKRLDAEELKSTLREFLKTIKS